MKMATKLLGLSAACAACCAALPLAGYLLAGSAALVLPAGSLGWTGIGGLAGIVGFLFWCLNRSRARTSAICGCVSDSLLPFVATPIACTLSSDDFKERIAWIRSLAKDSLREAQCDDLTLLLTYTKSAATHVRERVAKEQACCTFMQFDLHEDAGGIRLTITAPEEARAAATDLFAHFASELAGAAKSTSQRKELTV